jgi:hypothetical protein
MVSTRGHPTSPLNTGISNDKKKRPRPAPRAPKYPPHFSRAFVADLDDDIIDIGPKATPIVDLHKHYERKVNGGVVFFTREEVMTGRMKVRLFLFHLLEVFVSLLVWFRSWRDDC